MSGYPIPFEFSLSKRLLLTLAVIALVHLAHVHQSIAADDTLSSGNKNQMMIYGIVTRALLYADDGDRSELFHIDGGVENTRIGWIAQGRLNEDVTAGAHVELDVQLSNAAGDVNLIGTESTEQTAWGIRIQEVTATHRRYGKVSLGKGDTASTERVTVDLSGSDLATGNNPADMAGGIHFHNRTTGGRTITIGDVIDKVDGIDKDNRLRYDFPEVGGVGLALSYVAGGVWDVGFGYAREWGGFEFEMGAYYANVSARSTDDEDLWGGSGSLKHKSGLSLTLTGAIKGRKGIGQDNADYLWGKLGYSTALFDIGETHFGVSLGQYNDFAQNGDEATSLGVGIVQDLESIGSNLWILFRKHELDRAGNDDFDDIFIVSTGALFNF